MAGALPDNDDEKPLDPAAERVRRKLVRFMAINLSILFLALMAVVAALVYKSMTVPPETPTVVAGEVLDGEIVLPRGARIVSQSLSGDRLSLHIAVDAAESIVVYDIARRQIVGRFDLRKD